jgi:hypothetical protein
MSKWEYLYMGHWLPVPDAHHKKLDKRYERPSLDAIRLKTDIGTINGVPETRSMKFKMYGESRALRTTIRRGPKSGELTLIEIKDDDYPRVLSEGARIALFNDDGTPKTIRLEYIDSSEKFLCDGGQIYQEIDGAFVSRNYEDAGITMSQFEDITKTPYIWQLKGPFRWERMRSAVHKTCTGLPAEKSTKLRHLFSNFDPKEDATEYGPYQFGDYLAQYGEIELSIAVMENFHSQVESTWQSFSPQTNARIESARASGRRMAIVKVKGHMYMILFDSGSGASGADPVIIRPMRYQKILESIEEQFEQENNSGQSENQRRQLMSELFDRLVEHGHNPSLFLMSTLQQADPYATLAPDLRVIVEGIFERLQNVDQASVPGGLSTRIQQFMPVLLDKFKECEVRLAPSAAGTPKRLALKISKTLKTGLSVPKTFKCDWPDMIKFIAKQQCWVHSGDDSTCDICMEQVPTLKHCGSSSACLKCWAQTAMETNFSCPFCRQDIEPGQLKLQAAVRVNNKRKRVTETVACSKLSIDSIISKIHEDALYKDVRPETSFDMKKWFVILLRRGLINIHQRPTEANEAKTLEDAAKIFKLL